MRGFSKEIEALLAQGYSFQYCFQVTDNQGKCHHFIQSDIDRYIDGILYDSSIQIAVKSIEANDCAEDKAIIELIDNAQYSGLMKNLSNVKFDISLYFEHLDVHELYKSFYVSESKEDGAKIELHLHSMAKNFHQRMLQIYSKTCRADLGDMKCKVTTDRYMISSTIIELEDSCLVFDMEDLSYLPLAGGSIVIDSLGFTFRIISVRVNKLRIDNKNFDIKQLQSSLPIEAKLVAVCDKKLATCVQQYDNAVNFRGEPFIPGFEQFKL